MRAYRVSTSSVVGLTVTRFAGSQVEASQARRELMETYSVGMREVNLEEIDVPTDKKGLLAFLNTELSA
jgi:hypothetical protein